MAPHSRLSESPTPSEENVAFALIIVLGLGVCVGIFIGWACYKKIVEDGGIMAGGYEGDGADANYDGLEGKVQQEAGKHAMAAALKRGI
ncbi:hypothetical protein DIPPA_10463 [Diplonema papillatum]|nr:hypothetical protein DIPPA_10463 [Diplonema papillatum]